MINKYIYIIKKIVSIYFCSQIPWSLAWKTKRNQIKSNHMDLLYVSQYDWEKISNWKKKKKMISKFEIASKTNSSLNWEANGLPTAFVIELRKRLCLKAKMINNIDEDESQWSHATNWIPQFNGKGWIMLKSNGIYRTCIYIRGK